MPDYSWMNNYKNQIRIPTQCVKVVDKLEFLYNAEEALRLLHNEKGKDYREGRLTKEQWLAWKENFFEPRHLKIAGNIGFYKYKLKRSNRYPINLDTIEA